MASLAVVAIVQNEEDNIQYCIRSVAAWTDEIYVVDAFSKDKTRELAMACGAMVVQHEFLDWASQRNWALDNLPLVTDWVLFLDADEQATDAFKQEVDRALTGVSPDMAAFYVYFDFVFLGSCLRHAYESPPVIRLVRRDKALWKGAGAREYCQVDGKVGEIKSRIWHEDHKGLSAWIEKQNRNATREATLLWEKRSSEAIEVAPMSSERRSRVWIRERLWTRLPLFLRPFLYFLYRYLFKGGFLDGTEGLAYTFLQGFWFNFLIDAKYLEMQRTPL